MKRRKLFFWLKRNIFKVPEANICPKLLSILWYILFPSEWFCTKQGHIKYDAPFNRYIIYGVAYSAEIFMMFANHKGGKFEITKDNTITELKTYGNNNLNTSLEKT